MNNTYSEQDVARAYDKYAKPYLADSVFTASGEIRKCYIDDCKEIAKYCNVNQIEPFEYIDLNDCIIRYKSKKYKRDEPIPIYMYAFPNYQQLYLDYLEKQKKGSLNVPPHICDKLKEIVIELSGNGVSNKKMNEIIDQFWAMHAKTW